MNKLKAVAELAAEHLPEGGKLDAIKQAVQAVSPLAPNWQALLQEQRLVLTEDQLNQALAQAMPSEGPVAGAKLQLLGEDRLKVLVTPRVARVALMPLSLGLQLVACEATAEGAQLRFRITEGLAAAQQDGWLAWLMVPLVQVLLKPFFKPEWLQRLHPELVQVQGDELWVDLKAGPLAKAYEAQVGALLPAAVAQHLPAGLQLRPIDLLQIRQGAIAPGELSIAFSVGWPKGTEAAGAAQPPAPAPPPA